MSEQGGGRVLVTVGTTEFDELIEYADSQEFLELMASAGFPESALTLQFGTTGQYTPTHGNHFRLHPDIQSVYDAHEVVITHGGAGTLLACLHDPNPNKKIIAVANNSLAGNHQTQLIRKLHTEQYILGFNSVQQLQDSRHELLRLLRGEITLRKYQRSQRSVLNTLVFGSDE